MQVFLAIFISSSTVLLQVPICILVVSLSYLHFLLPWSMRNTCKWPRKDNFFFSNSAQRNEPRNWLRSKDGSQRPGLQILHSFHLQLVRHRRGTTRVEQHGANHCSASLNDTKDGTIRNVKLSSTLTYFLLHAFVYT